MRDIPCSSVGVKRVAKSPETRPSPAAGGQTMLCVAPGEVWEAGERTQGSSIRLEDLNRLASLLVIVPLRSSDDYSFSLRNIFNCKSSSSTIYQINL